MRYEFLEFIITVFSAVAASSGFWAFFTKRADRKSKSTQLLIGLAHEKIISLGMHYMERGWISKDEYREFIKHLYDPYKDLGGNGLAKKVVGDIQNLPFYKKEEDDADQ